MGWSAETVGVEQFDHLNPKTICRSLLGPGQAGVLMLVLGVCLAGCKSREGSLGRGSDPLVYGPDRIPRQNVPLPERGTVGQGRTDPLIAAPTGRAAPRDSSGGMYNDDPARFRGVHVPGPATTPAGLAGRWEEEGLRISDGPPERVPLRPVGEAHPATAPPPVSYTHLRALPHRLLPLPPRPLRHPSRTASPPPAHPCKPFIRNWNVSAPFGRASPCSARAVSISSEPLCLGTVPAGSTADWETRLWKRSVRSWNKSGWIGPYGDAPPLSANSGNVMDLLQSLGI
jgi:hypothetical protein